MALHRARRVLITTHRWVGLTIGLMLVIVGLWVRLRIHETPAFRRVLDRNERVRLPFAAVMRGHGRTLLLGTFAATATFVLFFFLVGVVPTQRRRPPMLMSLTPAGRGEDRCCYLEISTRGPWLATVIFGRADGLSRPQRWRRLNLRFGGPSVDLHREFSFSSLQVVLSPVVTRMASDGIYGAALEQKDLITFSVIFVGSFLHILRTTL
jgi:hypothetical protein